MSTPAQLVCTWFGVEELPVDTPVLVLGNSLGTTSGMWAPQIPVLASRFRVLAVETRGHGGSAVPPGPYTLADLGGDVLALLDELGVGRFRYAGLSLGGMVGMWLAAHVPDRVESLALVCTSAYLPPADGWRQRAATVRAEGTASLAEGAAGRWFTPGFRDRDPDTVRSALAMLAATPDEGYAGCCEAIAAMDLRRDLSRITAPTLVIAGTQDPATPPAHGAAIADAIGGALLEVIDEAAHLASLEQPEQITDLLLDHLDSVSEPAR